MSTLRRGLVVTVLLLAVGAGRAGVAPPATADLPGTWEVKFSGIHIDTTTGIATKFTETATWTVLQTATDFVLIQDFGSGLGEDYVARYYPDSGALVISQGLDFVTTVQVRVGSARVAGKPGALKLKGVCGIVDNTIQNRIEFTKFSGKWTGPLAPAKPVPPRRTSIAPVAAKPPPSAEDLDGAEFLATLSLKGYSVLEGTKGSGRETSHWTLTHLGSGRLNIHSTEPGGGDADDTIAYYVNGVFYLGASSDSNHGLEGVVALGTVSGVPGSLKIKAAGFEYEQDGDDDYFALVKIAAAEIPD